MTAVVRMTVFVGTTAVVRMMLFDRRGSRSGAAPVSLGEDA
jgi:hypothetical protein